MDAEIAKYKKEYPNLDVMMIETILKMTDEQHRKFQEGLESGEMCKAPTKFVFEDAVKIINCDEAEAKTDS